MMVCRRPGKTEMISALNLFYCHCIRNDSGSSNSSSVVVHDDQKDLEEAKDSPSKKRNFANKLHKRPQNEKSQ